MNLQAELCAVVNAHGSFRKLDESAGLPKSTVADIAKHPRRNLKHHPRLFNTVWLLRKLYLKQFGDPWPNAIKGLLEHFVEAETRFATGVINSADYRGRLEAGFKKLEDIWPQAGGDPVLEAGCLYVHATYLYDFAAHFCASLPLVKAERVRLLISQYARVRDLLAEHAPDAFAGTIDKARLNILATEMMGTDPAWALSDDVRQRIAELDVLAAAKRLAQREPMSLDLMNDGLQVASSAESVADCQYFWGLLTQELPFGVNPWRDPQYAPKEMQGITGQRMAFFYHEVYLKGLVPHFV
jgi:hypothetical protein